ncbi:hypothetical protein C8R44DRAFT_882436 [Mycena epipterygia]|nr:hypothetical protein C8R44DRAFT_882436 [Mycena epipterygia]
MISLVAVSMATVVLESLLYGLLLVLFSTNLYLRITRYARSQEFASRGEIWWSPIVISNIAIFATGTAHWIITVERFFLAFLGSAGDPLLFYLDESQPTSVVSTTLAGVAVLFGDAVIIHRLWLVWNWDLRVIFIPVLSWLAALTGGIAAFAYFFTQSTPAFLTADGPSSWVTVDWALTTLINIYCTTFIAWRIWRTSRATTEVGDGLLMPVFVILIESAAIWTTWTIFFAATFLTGSTLQFIVRDLAPAIIGLVNLLIHLRVGLGWSRAEAPDTTGALMTSTASIFAVNLRTENNEYCLESVSQTGPTSSKPGVHDASG